jgi:hypothetical protein
MNSWHGDGRSTIMDWRVYERQSSRIIEADTPNQLAGKSPTSRPFTERDRAWLDKNAAFIFLASLKSSQQETRKFSLKIADYRRFDEDRYS